MESVVLVIALCMFILYDKTTSHTKLENVLHQCNDLCNQLNQIKAEVSSLNRDLVTIIEENRQLNIEVYKLADEVGRLRINFVNMTTKNNQQET